MKTLTWFALILSPLLSMAQGGDIGNGGNVFWCPERPKGSRALFIDSAQMEYDSRFFPNKKQITLPGNTAFEKLNAFADRLRRWDSDRADTYLSFAVPILNELLLPQNSDQKRTRAFPKEHDEELYLRSDFNIRSLPKGCTIRPFINQLVKPIDGKPWLKFDPEIIPELSTDDLVKAVFHEVAYGEAIRFYLKQNYKINDINSDAVRTFIGTIGARRWDDLKSFCDYVKFVHDEVDFIQAIFTPYRGYRLDRGLFGLTTCEEKSIHSLNIDIPFRTQLGDPTTKDQSVNTAVLSRETGRLTSGILGGGILRNSLGSLASGQIYEVSDGLYFLDNGVDQALINQELKTIWTPNQSKYQLMDRAFTGKEIIQIETLFPCLRTTIEDMKGGEQYFMHALLTLKEVKTAIKTQNNDLLEKTVKTACEHANTQPKTRLGRKYRLASRFDSLKKDQLRNTWVNTQLDTVLKDHRNYASRYAWLLTRSFDSHDLLCKTRFDLEASMGLVFGGVSAGIASYECLLSNGRKAIYFGPKVDIGAVQIGAKVSLEIENPDLNDEAFRMGKKGIGLWPISAISDANYLFGVLGKKVDNHSTHGHPIYGIGLYESMGPSLSTPLPRVKKLPDDFSSQWGQLIQFIEAK